METFLLLAVLVLQLIIIGKAGSIMAGVKDFAEKQTVRNDRMDAAIAGLSGDIKALNDLIQTLQDTPGPISHADQATLDALEVKGDEMAARLEALDAATPPTPPPA